MVKVNIPQSLDSEKFRELILFIARKSEGDRKFGAVKLNKLLFYADFLAFKVLGKAITGHRYQRLDNGPAPRAVVPVLKELERDKHIAIALREYHGKQQKVVVALREADLSRFNGEEIALVVDILSECRDKNAKEISDMSHQFRGWVLAENGEDIPYEVALPKFEPPTASDIKHGIENSVELSQLARECPTDAS